MFAFCAPSAPVANWGVLGFPEALTIYNFIYSRFPSMAGPGPSQKGHDQPQPNRTLLRTLTERTLNPANVHAAAHQSCLRSQAVSWEGGASDTLVNSSTSLFAPSCFGSK